jgi:hypothetical protein
MENIVITPAGTDLQALRVEVGEATIRQYGAERRYAEALCAVLPAEWYLVEHNDKGEDAKKVHAEKDALYKVLKAANHTNPSTVWARVRKYAREHIEGVPEKTKGEGTGEGEGEGEGTGARHTRSPDLRLIEDLSALWKFLGRQQSLSDKQAQCKIHISSALNAMGVNPSTIE